MPVSSTCTSRTSFTAIFSRSSKAPWLVIRSALPHCSTWSVFPASSPTPASRTDSWRRSTNKPRPAVDLNQRVSRSGRRMFDHCHPKNYWAASRAASGSSRPPSVDLLNVTAVSTSSPPLPLPALVERDTTMAGWWPDVAGLRLRTLVEVMGFGARPGHTRRREQPWEQPPAVHQMQLRVSARSNPLCVKGGFLRSVGASKTARGVARAAGVLGSWWVRE
jgi:hypothetical protein